MPHYVKHQTVNIERLFLSNSPKILLVDNEPAHIEALEELLAEFNVNIYKAGSGNEAIAYTKTNEFSLIILDVHMPPPDGFETASLIRLFGKSKLSPIIFLTGSALEENQVFKGYEVGAVDYIMRPINNNILKSKVQIFLDLHKQKNLIEGQKIELEQALTLQKEISGKLETAQRESEEANKYKTSFLANMSHEIRTPLNAIIGFCQVLKREVSEDLVPPKFIEYLEHICTGSQILNDLINNILDLSKIEAGEMEVAEVTVNLKNLVDNIKHLNSSKASEKNLKLTIHYDATLPEFVKIDRPKLNQILMNLVSNAIKFTDDGKSITLDAHTHKNGVLFKVKDEGIGIAPENQKHIFKAFKQAGNEITDRYGGTGLGLAITRHMVKLLQGELDLDSAPGKGSTFSVYMPLKSVEVNPETPGSSSQKPKTKNRKPVILVAEDERLNQMLIKSMFLQMDHEIHIAGDGEDCIAQANKIKPDIIFMDMNMPKLNGIPATKILRKNPEFQHTPIIALSADAFIEQQQAALKAGITAYLTKPIDMDKLETVLNENIFL
ncbi:MAG: response regulator [Fibrobacteria bacterium]|nr:response regulator [Fibrobacteria bacterium]